MDRRALLLAGWWAATGLGDGAAQAVGGAAGSYKVSLAQLQRVLEQRFPLRYPVHGLLDIEILSPALRLLPQQNRLGTGLPLRASGPALRRPYGGTIDVDFELRYEASDQTLRAHRIRVNELRMDGLGRDGALLLDQYARAYAEQSLREVVLHQLQPRDLALASTMGLEPGAITVTPEGLVIALVPQKCSESRAGCPCTPASGECARP